MNKAKARRTLLGMAAIFSLAVLSLGFWSRPPKDVKLRLVSDSCQKTHEVENCRRWCFGITNNSDKRLTWLDFYVTGQRAGGTRAYRFQLPNKADPVADTVLAPNRSRQVCLEGEFGEVTDMDAQVADAKFAKVKP